jgi:hypothetical protein
MANHHSIPPSDASDDRIVEAAPDPQVERIADLTERSANDAAFAELEAAFAEQQREYADQLAEEGRKDDADAYAHDAIEHLKDAKRVMGQAREEESEAERLRRQRQQRLSTDLQTMPDQQLITLRDAVQSVRIAVEELSPRDLQVMRRLALVGNPAIEPEQIEGWRTTVINTAIRIEGTLENPASARHNAFQLVRDLSVFATVALDLAKLAPQLMGMIEQFGHLILQFHL